MNLIEKWNNDIYLELDARYVTQYIAFYSAAANTLKKGALFLPGLDGLADPCIDFIWFRVLICDWPLWNPGISKEFKGTVFVCCDAGGIDGFHDGVLGKMPVFPEYIPVMSTKWYFLVTFQLSFICKKNHLYLR